MRFYSVKTEFSRQSFDIDIAMFFILETLLPHRPTECENIDNLQPLLSQVEDLIDRVCKSYYHGS